MLESNHRTMQEISDAVGYQDVAFFRTLFQRHTGLSPSAYRERFGLEFPPPSQLMVAQRFLRPGGWLEEKGQEWRPLQVRYSAGQAFGGWWRVQNNLARTVVSDPPLPTPLQARLASVRKVEMVPVVILSEAKDLCS